MRPMVTLILLHIIPTFTQHLDTAAVLLPILTPPFLGNLGIQLGIINPVMNQFVNNHIWEIHTHLMNGPPNKECNQVKTTLLNKV